MSKNILIIAPHPDDEVLGCGATMAKYASLGHKVYVLIATRGTKKMYADDKIENVRNEALRAHKILGVSETFFLDFPAPELDTVPLWILSGEFSNIIQKVAAEVLYLPHRGDIHNDHKVVFDAGLVAARPLQFCTVNQIFAYETVSETEWAIPSGNEVFIPNTYENVTDFFEIKLQAFQCFASQIKDFPNPRSLQNLTALANYRGATVFYEMAEAFSLIRQKNF